MDTTGSQFDFLSYINQLSSGRFTRKNWEAMSQEEKVFLQALLDGSEVDAKDFMESSDFDKYDELTYADMNVYMFQPYFEDFEKIHTMPEELKEMIVYGGNPDEFLRLSDDEKRKYLRSLSLIVDEYYDYFDDEEKMYITQEILDQEQSQIDYRIEEYENAIDEYEDELKTVEEESVLLEQANKKLFVENKKLEAEIQNKQSDVNNAYDTMSSVIRELYEEKLRYLSLLSRSMRNRLSIQRITACFKGEYFSNGDIEKALAFLKKHGIRIVDGQEVQSKYKYDNADYSKTKAYNEAVKASEVNAFANKDSWIN